MFIKERNLTITEVAKGLNAARTNLSAVIHGHLRISPELAIKLSEAFGNTAQFWVNLQIIMSCGIRKGIEPGTDKIVDLYLTIVRHAMRGYRAAGNCLICNHIYYYWQYCLI